MRVLSAFLRSFAADERGTTAIEYGLIVSLIFLVIITSVEMVSGMVQALYALIEAMT